jgi:Leucine-rich repeat (LRR) protein
MNNKKKMLKTFLILILTIIETFECQKIFYERQRGNLLHNSFAGSSNANSVSSTTKSTYRECIRLCSSMRICATGQYKLTGGGNNCFLFDKQAVTNYIGSSDNNNIIFRKRGEENCYHQQCNGISLSKSVGYNRVPVYNGVNSSNFDTATLGVTNIDCILPDAFSATTNLINIRIASQKIKTLDRRTFLGLTNLQTLTLGSNSISVLPPDLLRTLKQLKYISVGRNPLTVIHTNLFKGLSNLRTIFLHKTIAATNQFPASIFKGLANLNELNIPYLDPAGGVRNNYQNSVKSNSGSNSITFKYYDDSGALTT